MSKILVLGATGFLGKRTVKVLGENSKFEIIETSKSLGLDLRDLEKTLVFFQTHKADYVVNCAAHVGGIQYGLKHQASIFYDNTLMSLNILEACKSSTVKRLINPVSNCTYPGRLNFFKEQNFWDGPLHESVFSYGSARKGAVAASQAYGQQHGLDTLNLIFSNMFGPEDHFEPERSHALGALIYKIQKAIEEGNPSVEIWGTGNPVREWLYVDDAASAMVRAIEAKPHRDIINIGVGEGISIKDLARIIADSLGYKGEFHFDISKPDGAPFKTVDGELGKKWLNWKPYASFKNQIKTTVEWYLQHKDRFNHGKNN